MAITRRNKLGKIATIGFFDGVHGGHRFLFEHLREEGTKRGLDPLIVTFDTHPRAVLQSDYVPQLLTSLDERKTLLSAFGEVKILPFADIHDLTAAEFMAQLKDEYDVQVLLMGYDHRFGSDRLQHPQDYRRIGESIGVEVLTMPEYTEGEWHVSSTEIRTALETGNVAVANELLGRPYSLCGTVVHGVGLGHTLGFPTANIKPLDPHKIIPRTGVYVASVNTPSMDNAPAFLYIGTNPTRNQSDVTSHPSEVFIEVHIPSFRGDLYGRTLEIRFMRLLREEKRFNSLEELKAQIKADIDSTLRQV